MNNIFNFLKNYYFLICVVTLSFNTHNIYSQATGDFRSFTTGNWNATGTWERFDGVSWINPAPSTPTNADGVITIQSGHIVTVTASVSADQMTIDAGGELVVNSGQVLTIQAGSGDDLTIDGTLTNNGTLTIFNDPPPPPISNAVVQVNGTLNNTGAINNAATNRLFFNSGSTYDHQYTTTAGTIPAATWNVSSTCQITGYTSNATAPAGLNQTFGNFTWNTPSSSGFIDLDGALTDVNGDLTFTSAPAYVYLTLGTGYTLNIDGDFTISTEFGMTDTGNITINVGGDMLMDGGVTFLSGDGNVTLDVEGSYTVSGGTHDYCYGTGTTTINVAGNAGLSAGTLSRSGTGTQTLIFDGAATRTFTSGATISNSMNFQIDNPAVVNMGTSFFSGGGSFTLAAGATLGVGSTHASGALQTGTSNGNMRVSGSRTYTGGSSIVYNGSGAQSLGNAFPSNVNLEINNSSGVSLTTGTTISVGRTLTITSGNLSIGANSLILNGDMVVTSGGLVGGTNSNLTIGGTGSFGTLSFVTTTTLNNFTINRTSSGNVTLGSALTTLGIFTQTAGDLTLNGNSFTINGQFDRTAGTIIGNSSSTLIVNGTGTLPASVALSGDLNTFTLDRASATFTTSASFAVTNLNLNSGTLDNGGTITMANNGILTRQDNGSMNAAPGAAGVFDVVYDVSGTLTTGNELPTNATDLDDLTKIGSGTVNLNAAVTINGILTLTNGIFDAGANGVTLEGNFVSNATSDFSGNTVTMAGTTVLSGGTTPTFNNLTVSSTFTPNRDYRIDGNLVNNGTFNAGSGNVTFGGTTTISGSGTPSFNIVTISVTLTSSTGSINVAGNFVNNGTFNNNGGTVIFNGTTSISGSSNPTFRNVTITGTLNSPTTLNVNGNWTNNGGTFNNNSNTVVFAGPVAQSIGGSSATTFYNMTVSNSNGVSVSGTANLRGTFTLSGAGVFDADGSGSGIFTIQSVGLLDSDDGRIAQMTTPANFTGNVTVQRFVDGTTGGDWRYLSVPVVGSNLSMWIDDFPVTGNFSDRSPNGSNNVIDNTAASVYTYNAATDAWSAVDGGGSATSTVSLSNTTGYSAYTFLNTDHTVDVRGTIGKGNVNISLTSGTQFNLVGNPYPSGIDGDAVIDNDVGLSSTFYIRTANNVFASWNAATNTPAGHPDGGLWAGEVSMGQSFWVESVSSGTLALTEARKIGAGDYRFVKQGNNAENVLKIKLGNGSMTDETVIIFNENTTDGFDYRYDGKKFINGYYNKTTKKYSYINLSSYNSDPNLQFVFNTIPQNCETTTVNIKVNDVLPGQSSLEFSGLGSFNHPYSITLVDHFEGVNVNVEEGFEYLFNVTSDASSYGANRFDLVFSVEPVDLDISLTSEFNEICNGQDVQLILANSEKFTDYIVYRNGQPIVGATGNGNPLEINVSHNELVIGDNLITIEAVKGECSTGFLVNDVTITYKDELDLDLPISTDNPDVCYDGTAIISVSNSDPETQYRVYNDGEPITDYKFGNSNNLDFEVLSDNFNIGNNVLTIEAFKDGCQSTIMNNEVVVNRLSQLNVDIPVSVQNQEVCSGNVAVLLIYETDPFTDYIVYVNESATTISETGTGSQLSIDIESQNLLSGNNNNIKIKAVKSDCDSEFLTEQVSVYVKEGLTLDLPVTSDKNDVCKDDVINLNIGDSKIDSEYSIYLNGTLISNSKQGNGSEISFEISADVLASGQNALYTLVDVQGCESAYLNNVVEVNVEETPQVELIESIDGCKSESTTIMVGGAPAQGAYYWYATIDSAQPFEITSNQNFITPELEASRSYYVSAVNSLGCEGERIKVEVEVIEINEPIVSVDGNLLVSNIESDLQWFRDNEPIEGANENTYEVTETGNYFVRVTVGGCTSDSENIVVTITGVNILDEYDLNIFPNPFNDRIFIQNNSSIELISFKLFGPNGKLIGQGEFTSFDNNIIETPVVGKGVYILNIVTSEGNVVYRLLKE